MGWERTSRRSTATWRPDSTPELRAKGNGRRAKPNSLRRSERGVWGVRPGTPRLDDDGPERLVGAQILPGVVAPVEALRETRHFAQAVLGDHQGEEASLAVAHHPVRPQVALAGELQESKGLH